MVTMRSPTPVQIRARLGRRIAVLGRRDRITGLLLFEFDTERPLAPPEARTLRCDPLGRRESSSPRGDREWDTVSRGVYLGGRGCLGPNASKHRTTDDHDKTDGSR